MSSQKKMTQVFSAFAAWTSRGVPVLRKPSSQGSDEMLQEYEAAIMPVLPQHGPRHMDEHISH